MAMTTIEIFHLLRWSEGEAFHGDSAPRLKAGFIKTFLSENQRLIFPPDTIVYRRKVAGIELNAQRLAISSYIGDVVFAVEVSTLQINRKLV